MQIREHTLQSFISALSSKEPVPGGGGASALIGALGAALCSMVANLTSGKKKYEMFQADIENILSRSEKSSRQLIWLIEEDAKAFAPLAAAYSLPKENAQREKILEDALVLACLAPMEILRETAKVAGFAGELAKKGSRLVISDVGVAVSACRAAAQGAAMNVYINTKLMKNRDQADKTNGEAEAVLNEIEIKCENIYKQITDELKG
ncbi:MAG: cyclodeaminase/cyclohydrolase family protein [Oscillospiraceae bacterium]|nr:cyclodeaminase/cyclohydrolase family protein [Oscillospiraceae bacterium]